ncbi:MAG TPA: insulinase family protein, partial [Chitinophagaceae bacterium]|nr:insulinase family protein [Chitinophagaceae bacterium]
GIGGSSSVKDFETFLQLVNLYFTQPRRDEALFNSFVTKQKGQLQFASSNPQYFFQDTLTKIAYNSSPWISVVPTMAEYEDLNLDHAISDYKKVFDNADGMHFTFVGNIDPAIAKSLFEKYLGSLPGKPGEHNFKDNGARPIQGTVLANIKKGKESQSFINILWSGETQYNREESLAFRALIDAMNIKIIEKLREEMSGIYGGGLSGSIQKRPYVHFTITANIPCGPENVDKLTDALFGLIKDAQEKGVEQKDLDKVKETWKKQYQVGLQNNEAWLDNLSNAFIDHNDPENILNYEQKIDALTVQDLQKAAQKFLSTTNYIKAVLYPENANVQEGVKKAF